MLLQSTIVVEFDPVDSGNKHFIDTSGRLVVLNPGILFSSFYPLRKEEKMRDVTLLGKRIVTDLEKISGIKSFSFQENNKVIVTKRKNSSWRKITPQVVRVLEALIDSSDVELSLENRTLPPKRVVKN